MTTTEERPVDRDAWRRLLAGDGDAPPELTDARIRAKARTAIAPRGQRWWLPASLAASLLLAVVLVQQQYERSIEPAVVSESDYATAPAADQPAPPPGEATLPAVPPQPDAEAPQPQQERSLANAASPASAERRTAAKAAAAESSRLDGFVAPPPVAPPPQADLPATADARATSAAPAEVPEAEAPATLAAAAESKREEKDVREIVVTGSRRRADDRESDTPVTQATAGDVTTQGVSHAGGLLKSGVAERTPEQWYAEIERLRAAGKKREAKRELDKLRKVHPGWLEKNHPNDR